MNKATNQLDKIEAKINLIKLPANNSFEFELGSEIDWVKEILLEMNEHATEKSASEYLKETKLKITGEMIKKNNQQLGEYLLVKGTIAANYATECIRTLEPMSVELTIPFKVVFLDKSLEHTESFSEIDETYIDNDVYDLYYSTNRQANFQEMLHEQIFLNYDQYPTLDAHCPLQDSNSK